MGKSSGANPAGHAVLSKEQKGEKHPEAGERRHLTSQGGEFAILAAVEEWGQLGVLEGQGVPQLPSHTPGALCLPCHLQQVVLSSPLKMGDPDGHTFP